MSISIWSKIALTKIPSVGPKTARRLVSYCGGIEQIFDKSSKQLKSIPGVGPTIARNVSSATFRFNVDEELKKIEKSQVEVLCYLDKDYPERLTHYPDSPVVIYKKGKGDLNPKRTVGIVGTRKPSSSGKFICERLVSELAQMDLTILSGLAYGIDITAHKKCLELNMPTFAVLGSGLNKVYPTAHKKYVDKMLEEGGALSEFELDMTPENANFPMRNRIIAAMSDAIIVVESRIKGGSMITADLANSYNKDVFAIPGRPQDRQSQGCNHLIKQNKAALIDKGEDVIEFMNWNKEFSPRNKQLKLINMLTDEEQIVFSLIEQSDGISPDNISHRSEKSLSKTHSILLSLELKGLINSIPGNRFILAG